MEEIKIVITGKPDETGDNINFTVSNESKNTDEQYIKILMLRVIKALSSKD